MKPFGTVWTPIVLLATLTLYLTTLSGCDSKPTDPPSGVGDVNYAVYFYSQVGSKKLYKYYPLTQELDSADLQYEQPGYDHFESLSVSADGDLLYMPFEQSVIVFDSDSLNPVAELPYQTWTPIAISPDGQRVGVLGNGVRILNTSDFSVFFYDTTSAHIGVFSADGMRLYARGRESHPPYDSYIYILDLSGPVPVSEKVSLTSDVNRVLPTTNESELLLLGGSSSFSIYDVDSDAILFTHTMLGVGGRMALSPGGRYAYYGSPASILPPDPGTAAFAVIDVQNKLINEMVSTQFVVDSVTPDRFDVGSIIATPDGKYLVMLDAPWPHQLMLYDLEKREFIDYIQFGGYVELTDMDLRILTE